MSDPILKYQEGVFVFYSDYHERHIPKEAGFHWHVWPCSRKDCPACNAGLEKCWFTVDDNIAAKLINYADKEAHLKLGEIAIEKEKAIEASRARESDLFIPVPDELEYYPFQRAGIGFANERESCLIADEMGLGKTLQALGLINLNKDIQRVLVICPASLKINWKRETEKWLFPGRFKIEIAESKMFPWYANFIIMNYDILGKHRESLREKEWDLIILDEGHYIKNRDSQRHQEIVGSKKNEITPIPAKRKLVLTGTPIENRPEEIWAIWHYLDPEKSPNYYQFMQRYYNSYREEVFVRGQGGKKRTVWKYGEPKNLDDLQMQLRSSIMIRRKTDEVLQDLPPKRRQIIELPLNGLQNLVQREFEVFEEHKQIKQDKENARLLNDDVEYRERIKELNEMEERSLAELATIRRELALEKLPFLIEHLQEAIDSHGKVICFCYHREIVEKLQDHFGSAAVHLYGGMNGKKKQESVDRFNDDKEVKLFIASILAAGVGLTLTISNIEVFGELDWVPGRIEQAEKRAHRIGQERPVLVQHIVFESSLDSYMAKSMVEKMEKIDLALDV
jgi:SWI/SNF-related matrix-associated actin-dependent regulator 1 of chromatin subfamily A